jgi:ribonuclease P protein component
MRAAPRGASASPSESGRGVKPAGGGAALRSSEVERALATKPCARSEHFLLHHVTPTGAAELSTAVSAVAPPDVDDCRFGLVVPKRHARRAVTRNLIKRQGRNAFVQHAPSLRAGDWLLRLRSAYPAGQFPSAASEALRRAVRSELQQLFGRAASR